ncbi:MAG TPA: potassium-transporting ATPase subunit C [Acidimicrobiales bacterium]|nr:potassium-transporting ATPase subunit C [Acidimicrobiales bacterium]
MLTHLRRSVVLIVICTVLFGFVYAFAGTGVAQVLFKNEANGQVGVNGSPLIGQNWSSPKWFHGRPDDTGPYANVGDDPLVANGRSGESAATNLGPRSKKLLSNTQALKAYWHKLGVNPTPDLVTTSGSGYDPDITPLDATVQIPMVSHATGIAPSTLKALIVRETHGAQLGFLGSPYIVVLQLNEALAQLR